MHACAQHACLVPTRRGCWLPWDWSCMWLWAVMWMVGSKFMSSARAGRAPKPRVISPALGLHLCQILWMIFYKLFADCQGCSWGYLSIKDGGIGGSCLGRSVITYQWKSVWRALKLEWPFWFDLSKDSNSPTIYKKHSAVKYTPWDWKDGGIQQANGSWKTIRNT